MNSLLMSLLSTNTVIGLVVGAAVAWLVKWLAGDGARWKVYEGYAITAIRMAEKAVPDGASDTGAARLDYALKTFLAKYKAATGVAPDEAAVAKIESWISALHNAMDEAGALGKKLGAETAERIAPAAGFIRPRLMARLGLLSLLLLAGWLLAGCSTVMTDNQSKYVAETAQAYYNAPNVATLWRIENTNANQVCEFTVKNFTLFEMNTPVPAKNIIPRDPTVWETIMDGVKTVAPYAFLGYAVSEGTFGGGSSTTTSTVNNYSSAATP